jgi:hypothetical protein
LLSELYTENIFASILKEGQEKGVFVSRDHQIAAGAIKAMLQDWYLKRRKFAAKKVTVDRYADFVLEFVEAFYLTSNGNHSGMGRRTNGL